MPVNLFPIRADFNFGKKSAGAKSVELGVIKCHNSIRGQELPCNQFGMWSGIIREKSPGARFGVLRVNVTNPL
ncbi:hypothetical protein TNCV_3743441 [Trichonephila clavipes]|nr:hypothetical protein TNCV_3743441 [Trichonephila clavipes]